MHLRRRRLPRSLLIPVVLGLPALAAARRPAVAQAVLLDEGRFTLFVGGKEAGSESFRIQRGGSGADARILSTAVVQLESGGRSLEMRPMMEASVGLVTLTYENKISGTRTAQINGFVSGGRFVSRVESGDGEMQREYRFGPTSALLEDHVAHLYYFVAPRLAEVGAAVSVIVPSTGEQLQLSVLSSEVEPFRLGRERLQVRHLRLEGNGVLREIWVDDQGRILRVEIPSADFRAERDPA